MPGRLYDFESLAQAAREAIVRAEKTCKRAANAAKTAAALRQSGVRARATNSRVLGTGHTALLLRRLSSVSQELKMLKAKLERAQDQTLQPTLKRRRQSR